MGLKGPGNPKFAYLWANKPLKDSYVPSSGYQYASLGELASITRQGVGLYTVTFVDMPKGGSAQVTVYGSKARRCQIGSIRKDGLPQRVAVRCFKGGGDPGDARFSLSYEK
jgi:hypothetical protein